MRATCEECGAPMTERKRKRACSGKCRAALSRREQDTARRRRDQAIRELLEAVLAKLGTEAS